MFKPIATRGQLSKIVAGDIEKAIFDKKFLPGEKLPSEQDFCTQFNVSRTAVREALQFLSAIGLIKIEKGKGAFVKEFGAETVTDPMYRFLEFHLEREYIIDVIRARQIIEPAVAAMAATHRTEKDVEKLRKNIERHRDSLSNKKKVAEVDMEFHLLLAKASNNELIPLILDPIHRLMPKIKVAILETVEDSQQKAVEWHSRILQHIINKEADQAHEAMKRHLEVAEEDVLFMLDKGK